MTGSDDRLLIFDCDGVLVDSEPISFDVLHETLHAAGAPVSRESAYRDFLGKSIASVSDMMSREFGITITEQHLSDMRHRLFERFRAELQPMANLIDVLETLALPHCVASSSQPERIRLSLEITGLLRHFEPNIFSATMVENGKPAPDLFLHAARNMGFAPENCIVIEDSPAGLEAARAAEMTVFAFTGGSHAAACRLSERVSALKPDAIFDDMAALPGLLAAER